MKDQKPAEINRRWPLHHLGNYFVASMRRQPAVAGAFLLLILLFLFATTRSPGFASLSNIQSLSIFASFIGLAAMGETFVIITGGIDLSIPWIVDFGGIGLSQLQTAYNLNLALAAVVIVILGMGLGAVNGFFVTFLRAPALIVTLGVGGLIEGYLLAVGTLQSSGDSVSQQIQNFANSKIGPVPGITLVWIILAILAATGLSRTANGRRIFAVGDNPRAARLAGIDVNRVRFIAYVFSGGTASLAGLFLTGFIQTAYVGMGADYLFGAIAAIALGGTALLGGKGSSWGTVAGACTLTVLSGLLPMLGLSSAAVQIVYGVVILLGVYFARTLHRLSSRHTGVGAQVSAMTDAEPISGGISPRKPLAGRGGEDGERI
jgi:ribose transport system permease protein